MRINDIAYMLRAVFGEIALLGLYERDGQARRGVGAVRKWWIYLEG